MTPATKTSADETVVASALAELPTFLGYLERELGGHEWLVAERFTLADLSVACQIVNLRHARVEIDAGAYPALARWFLHVSERPTLAPLIEQDRSFLGRRKG